MFRKLLALLLCLGMMLAAGCGEETGTTVDDHHKSSKESKTTTSVIETGITTTTGFVTTTTATETTATTTTTQASGTLAPLTDEEKIIGQWEAEIALGDALNAQAEESGIDAYFNFDGMCITLRYEFKEDGTTAMAMQADNAFAEKMKAAYLDGMEAYIDAFICESGYASAETFCEFMGCDSMEELYDKMATMLSEGTVTALNAVAQEGVYRFEDGYLCLGTSDIEEDEIYSYTLTATRLLLNYVGEVTEENDSVLQTLMPLTFKKV